MKTSSEKPTGFARASRATALAAALLLLGSLPGIGQGADPSGGSSFTWDCLTKGANQPGIAYLTFSNDYTFKGYLLISGTPAAGDDNSRNPAGEADQRGEGLSSSSGSGTNANFFVFGFTPVNGPWGYDSKGRVIGFFTEILSVTTSVTNYLASTIIVAITNSMDSGETTNILVSFTNTQTIAITDYTWPSTANTDYYTNYNTSYDVVPSAGEGTNTVSFAGKVVPGQRLTLSASTPFGKVTFKGVPATTLPSLDGTAWYGDKRQNNQHFVEFFNLNAYSASVLSDHEFPGGVETSRLCRLPQHLLDHEWHRAGVCLRGCLRRLQTEENRLHLLGVYRCGLHHALQRGWLGQGPLCQDQRCDRARHANPL